MPINTVIKISRKRLNTTTAAAVDLLPCFENLYHLTAPPAIVPGRKKLIKISR